MPMHSWSKCSQPARQQCRAKSLPEAYQALLYNALLPMHRIWHKAWQKLFYCNWIESLELESAIFAASGGGANWRGALRRASELDYASVVVLVCLCQLVTRAAVSTEYPFNTNCDFFRSNPLEFNYTLCSVPITTQKKAICDALRSLSLSRNNFLSVSFIFVLRYLLQQHHFTFYSFVPPCFLFSKLSNSLDFACRECQTHAIKKNYQQITTGNTNFSRSFLSWLLCLWISCTSCRQPDRVDPKNIYISRNPPSSSSFSHTPRRTNFCLVKK